MGNDQKNRLIVLDVIKAICIIMVILRHVAFPEEIQRKILYPFTILPAVPIFLMCSVFVYCYVEDRNNGTILSWFSNKVFWKRMERYLLPFLVSVAVLIAGLFLFMNIKRISLYSIYRIIQFGGRGPGNYYVLIIFQFMVIFPFLRYFYKKQPAATVVALVLIHIAYETLCKYWQLGKHPYYELIFRYLTHLGLGFLLYTYAEQLRKTAIPLICIVIGTIYLINVYYLGYQPVLEYDYSTRGIIASLFSFGVLCYVLRIETILTKNLSGGEVPVSLRVVCHIGKASYHIMLTQMVFFYFVRYFEIEARMGSLWLVLLMDLAVPLSAGCLFYAIDQWIHQKLYSLRKKALA